MKRLLWSCAALVVCAVASGPRAAAAQGTTACDSPCKVILLPRVTWGSQKKLPFIVQQVDSADMPIAPIAKSPQDTGRTYFEYQVDKPAKLPPFERDVAVSAEPVNNVMPSYPPLLRIARMSGTVVASFVVDRSGRVDAASFQVVHATEPQFAVAVLEAIPSLRFTPAVDRNGRKVAQLVRESVEFRWLRGGMTQVGVRADGCTLANQAAFADVPECASPPAALAPRGVPISWGWSFGGENVTGAYARSGNFSPGVVVGAQVQFPLPSRHLALRVDGMYHWIGENDFSCVLAIPDRCFKLGDHSQVVTFGLNLVARLNDPRRRWSPYLVGGVGINLTTGDRAESIYDFRPNRGGFQGGAGFEFRLRHATTFVEARYIGVPPGGLAVWNVGFRY